MDKPGLVQWQYHTENKPRTAAFNGGVGLEAPPGQVWEIYALNAYFTEDQTTAGYRHVTVQISDKNSGNGLYYLVAFEDDITTTGTGTKDYIIPAFFGVSYFNAPNTAYNWVPIASTNPPGSSTLLLAQGSRSLRMFPGQSIQTNVQLYGSDVYYINFFYLMYPLHLYQELLDKGLK